MRLVAFFIALILFVGALLLFGFSFSMPVAIAPWMFLGGIATVCLSLAIPFHILGRTD